MKGIIDRFEGDYAVVEWDGKQMKDIPRRELPPEIRVGDVIRVLEGAYVFDEPLL